MKQTVWVALAIAALFGSADASAKKAEFSLPPYAGLYEPQGKDERGLWMELDEVERGLRDAPRVVRDTEINTYLRKVLCDAVGSDRCKAVRIYLIQNDVFNASMAPNGMMQVNTGLLSRVHSEAELASILGHEFAHFERRHTLQKFREARNSKSWANWLLVLGAGFSVNTTNARNSLVIGFWAFSRSMEVEADLLGANFINASHYRLQASSIWKRSLQEDNAIRSDNGMRKIMRLTPGLTDSHPTDMQRVLYFEDLEMAQSADGDDGKDRYRAATNRILPLLFDGLVKSNQFGSVDFVIRGRGDALGWNGELTFYHAELYRLRGNPRDLMTARDLYVLATKFSDAPPEVWRGLGLCELRLGNTDAGKVALREYLLRNPAAKDADSIKLILEG